MKDFTEFEKMSFNERAYYVRSLDEAQYEGDYNEKNSILNKIVFSKNEYDYNYYLELLKEKSIYYTK